MEVKDGVVRKDRVVGRQIEVKDGVDDRGVDRQMDDRGVDRQIDWVGKADRVAERSGGWLVLGRLGALACVRGALVHLVEELAGWPRQAPPARIS